MDDNLQELNETPIDELVTEIVRLRKAIRDHRDQKGDDRCWMDDDKLYAVLPEGRFDADTRLHSPEVMLENCKRYIKCRHDPSIPYVSPQRQIEELQAKLERSKNSITIPREKFIAILLERATGLDEEVKCRFVYYLSIAIHELNTLGESELSGPNNQELIGWSQTLAEILFPEMIGDINIHD